MAASGSLGLRGRALCSGPASPWLDRRRFGGRSLRLCPCGPHPPSAPRPTVPAPGLCFLSSVLRRPLRISCPQQLRIRPNPERPRTAPAPPVPECLPGAFRQQTATAGVALVARERLPRTCSPLRLPRSTPDGHARPPGTFVNAASRRRHCFLLPSGPCLSRLVPDTPLTHSPRRPKVPSFRLAPLTRAHALPAVPVSTLNLSKLPVLKRRAQDTHAHTHSHSRTPRFLPPLPSCEQSSHSSLALEKPEGVFFKTRLMKREGWRLAGCRVVTQNESWRSLLTCRLQELPSQSLPKCRTAKVIGQ